MGINVTEGQVRDVAPDKINGIQYKAQLNQLKNSCFRPKGLKCVRWLFRSYLIISHYSVKYMVFRGRQPE